jgi:hypothetical protein
MQYTHYPFNYSSVATEWTAIVLDEDNAVGVWLEEKYRFNQTHRQVRCNQDE